MDSLILQTAIGLVFIFATAAGLVSAVTESISRYVGLRAEFLLRGLRTLLDGGGNFKLPIPEAVTGRVNKERAKAAADAAVPAAAAAAVAAATTAKTVAEAKAAQAAAAGERRDNDKDAADAAQAAQAAGAALAAARAAAQLVTDPARVRPPAFVARIMAHPLVGVTTKATAADRPANAGDAPVTNKQRRQLPSYLAARSFAQALIDLIVPNSAGVTTMTQIEQTINDPARGDIPEPLRAALVSMAKEADTDIAAFRTNLEHWYDDQMARVSGWYKRHVRWVSLGIGLVLVVAFNLNVLTIARSIYTDQALRGSVVTQATEAAQCKGKEPAACLQDLRAQIDKVRGAGLPIGWTTVPQCGVPKSGCNWFEDRGFWVHNGRGWALQTAELGLILLGWGLMVIALLPGANFWFDLLGRLGSLRTTGPKPAPT